VKHKILVGALCAVMMPMPVFAETVADLLQTTPEGSYKKPASLHHALVSYPRGYGCYEKAYTLYASNGAGASTEKEKKALKKQIENDFRELGGTAQSIGHYIGMTIGMRMIERKSDTQLSYYKASACAIRKAGEMSITDPRMIVGAVGVVGNSYRLAKQQQAFFDKNTKTGDLDLSRLQKEQKAFGENTAAYVRMTSAIADMRCDISEAEADDIHMTYIMDKFLSKMSDATIAEMNAPGQDGKKSLSEMCVEKVIGLVSNNGKKKA
jgi:hypothetical protein